MSSETVKTFVQLVNGVFTHVLQADSGIVNLSITLPLPIQSIQPIHHRLTSL
jgi:hypothetical protein